MRNNTNPFDGIDRTAHIIHLTNLKNDIGYEERPTLCGKTVHSLSGSVIYVGATHELQWWYYNICKECKESDDYALHQLANCGE